MGFHVSNSLIETYRYRAKSKNIENLNGRNGNRLLTKFIITKIIEQVSVRDGMNIIDVGCGDASLFKVLLQDGLVTQKSKLIGILPTAEEVERVANDIERNYSNLSNKLSIVRGTADNLDISTGQADLLICNGVLHGNGQNYNDFKKSLKEFNRVLKIGGTVYIGELPDVDEMKGKNYGNSLLQWLIYLKKERGLNDFIDGLKTILKSIFGSEPFIFVPKYMFFIERKQLGKVLKAYGFKIISEKRHQEITHEGKEIQSNTRWNYVAVKSKNVN